MMTNESTTNRRKKNNTIAFLPKIILFVAIAFISTLNISAQKKEKCYVRNYKHVSKIDTVKFNTVEGYSNKMEYVTKWKEKCKGFTMGYKADFISTSLVSGGFIGYRGHRTRQEIEIMFGENESYGYKHTHYLASFYLDINKHATTPIKPYLGVNAGMMSASNSGMDFIASGTGGINLRIFPGFYILGEFRYYLTDTVYDEDYSINCGVRINL